MQMPIQDSVNLNSAFHSTSLPATAASAGGALRGVYSTLAENIEDNIRRVEGQLHDFPL